MPRHELLELVTQSGSDDTGSMEDAEEYERVQNLLSDSALLHCWSCCFGHCMSKYGLRVGH